MTLRESMYTNCHKSSVFALVRHRARKLVSGRQRACEVCKYDKHVEVCHIKPIKTYPLDTLLSVVNAPDNLRLLCPNCHWELDNTALSN